MSSSYYQYQSAGSLPVHMPTHGKAPEIPYTAYRHHAPSTYRELSSSPPESRSSVSSGGGLYSSVNSASYAASIAGSDCESSSNGASSVDLLDYMNSRLSDAYNPLPMDRNLVGQAQM
jgi:hypothetical protein